MAFVKFPHKVKVNGVYYAPGTLIEVDNTAKYVKQGEEIVRGNSKVAKPAPSRKDSTRKKR